MDDRGRSNPITSLVYEIGQAARAGWAQTARMIALLAAVALVIQTSR